MAKRYYYDWLDATSPMAVMFQERLRCKGATCWLPNQMPMPAYQFKTSGALLAHLREVYSTTPHLAPTGDALVIRGLIKPWRGIGRSTRVVWDGTRLSDIGEVTSG